MNRKTFTTSLRCGRLLSLCALAGCGIASPPGTVPTDVPTAGAPTAGMPATPGAPSMAGAAPSMAGTPSAGAPSAGQGTGPQAPHPTPAPVGPTAVSVEDSARFEALRMQAEAARGLDAQAALSAYPAKFRAGLDYDPLKADRLDTIQASHLALSDGELKKVGEQGFVISTRREFGTFQRGLAEIYSEHLPLYVSADSLLESIHSSYDTILMNIESEVLIPELQALLSGMHARIPSSNAEASTKADADLYVAVARGLLQGTAPEPVAGADRKQISGLINSAVAAQGLADVTLFGTQRTEDFSQFKPRGHYERDLNMQRYFRAMMWLGRVDLRLIETLPNGSEVFRPEQFRATLLLHALIDPDLARWQKIDTAIRTFVGDSDNMVVSEVGSLITDLGGVDAAKAASADTVVAAIVKGGYGKQQIASYFMVNDGTLARLPLNRSFLVFGQRYIVDSHVFSEVVFDRVSDRFMPNPLDAAFAAFGNNQALALELPELMNSRQLPGALARMRVLIDAHDADFWKKSFYGLWFEALRALSPHTDLSAAGSKLPQVAQTEAWGRRVLNAQLASWAELRHDTLLYAKQSYTGAPGCEFPDVYVDPYPEMFDAMVRYAEQGARIVTIAQGAPSGSSLAAGVATYFDALRNATSRLAQMAKAQRDGQPLTAEQLAFINDAVRVDSQAAGCTTIDIPNGWYAKLFYDPSKSLTFDPTIADVHTQPADAGGTIVGKVLHVGTGYPRYMVATIDTCNGPRAYAGVVSAYHEQITTDFIRLTDSEWAQKFVAGGTRPSDVPWMAPLLSQ